MSFSRHLVSGYGKDSLSVCVLLFAVAVFFCTLRSLMLVFERLAGLIIARLSEIQLVESVCFNMCVDCVDGIDTTLRQFSLCMKLVSQFSPLQLVSYI
jgi:hypothetical protein